MWLCDPCLEKIPLVTFQMCPACERTITENGLTCEECRRNAPPVDGIMVAVNYHSEGIVHIISVYKYRFARDLHVPLGKLILRGLRTHPLPAPHLIIPIPLHPRRERWRGFNQSELLARYVSANLFYNSPIPVDTTVLTRKRYTPPQMKIKIYAERKENVRYAFSLNNTNSIQDKTILLIDDIATTGSTLSECARMLKQQGARKVYAAVISRQEYKIS